MGVRIAGAPEWPPPPPSTAGGWWSGGEAALFVDEALGELGGPFGQPVTGLRKPVGEFLQLVESGSRVGGQLAQRCEERVGGFDLGGDVDCNRGERTGVA
jgi:hypothetical protein